AISGKSYLSLKHTAKNTRKEIFVPVLSDRDRRGVWQKAGAKEIMDKAKEKVEKILESQKGPGISEEVESRLNEYYKNISKRTYDDYRKLEGMEDSNETIDLPNSQE
ncbi:MAG: trimethylamine methyltransferase family protein, partial [Promethearchaeota archaeon]